MCGAEQAGVPDNRFMIDVERERFEDMVIRLSTVCRRGWVE